MKKLTPNEIEAVNRAEATALLIRAGYRVYRPEADCDGEDLILRTPSGRFYPVQLKARPTVDLNKFGKKGLWMLFPGPGAGTARSWYLVPHDLFHGWVKRDTDTRPSGMMLGAIRQSRKSSMHF